MMFHLLRMSVAGLVIGSLGVTTASALPSDLGWTTFVGDAGTRVQYPAELFPVARGKGNQPGHLFISGDGRARLRVYTVRNEYNESPARYLRRVFDQRRSRLTYDRVAPNFFAISAPDRGLILYRRCNFSDLRGGMMHCVDIRYPSREKRAWDSVVTRISLSLRPKG
jgi:hypothetical protein